MTSLTPALVGIAGVLAGALLTALTAAARERVGRRDKAQQEALYALQDACLAHRQAYQSLGTAEREDAGSFLVAAREVDRTRQVLEVAEARVLCDQVLEVERRWRDLVAPAILRDDVRDIPAAEEDAVWRAVQTSVQQELRWLSYRRTR